VKRLLLGALAVAALVTGCTFVSHVSTLQPTPVPPSPSIRLPKTVVVHAQPGKFQRGIDIDAYTYPRQDIVLAAAADIAYAVKLHANAISISFPFFMSGPTSSRVYGTTSTPTPNELAVLITDAKHAGLYVSLRPLLAEGNLGYSRVHWTPVNPRAWFASYAQFLRPYAEMANRTKVQEFIVGAEFTQFASWPRWNNLDAGLHEVFHGKLGCANTTPALAAAANCGRGVVQTVDAYPSERGNLLRGWERYDRSAPHGTVETEVGIDAVPGAFRKPYVHAWPGIVPDPGVQARWFAAACRAAVATHLSGIYFWALAFGRQIGTGPSEAHQGTWAGGAGAQAISACFQSVERHHR
jgi:Glycoside Hydrolase Family 113